MMRESSEHRLRRDFLADQFEQGTLALDYSIPVAMPFTRPVLRVVTAARDNDQDIAEAIGYEAFDDGFFDKQRTGDDKLPDPVRWSTRITQAILEVAAGRRSPHQLTRWTTHEVLTSLTNELKRQQRDRSRQAQMIKSIHVSRPADGVVEVCAIVSDSHRSRAAALRLEGWDNRWLCTSFQLV